MYVFLCEFETTQVFRSPTLDLYPRLAGYIFPQPTPILISHLPQEALGCLLRFSPYLTRKSYQGLAGRADEPTLEGVGGAGGSAVPGCGFETHQSGSEADRRKGRQAGAGSSGAQQKGPSEVWGLQSHGLQGQRLLLVWQDRSGQHACPEAVGYSHSESRSQTT